LPALKDRRSQPLGSVRLSVPNPNRIENAMNTIIHIAVLGSIVGIAHFVIIGALYGNPIIARLYRAAEADEPGVRRWPSRRRYLITQFLGTQVEVFILATAYVWLLPHGATGALALAVMLAAVRVYPRFWNMWIQSTYPAVLLKVELVNGVVSTFVIVLGLHLVSGAL
jgi:hypothetical protein